MGKYLIGVDMGATNLKIGLVDTKGLKILKKKNLSTASFPNRPSLLEAIIKAIFSLSTRNKILAIGIGLPGLVDAERGFIHYLVNIPDWRNVHLKKIFEKRLAIPTFIDNDVNVITLAEYFYGRARGYRNIICVSLGTGVGGGLILEGRLYRGTSFSAGEIGHIPINEEGPSCNCGGRGCLERYVGSSFVIEKVIERIREAPLPTIIPDLVEGDLSKITPRLLTTAVRKGDLLARQLWQEIARHLGIGLAGVVNLLNPEVIVIGGGVAGAGKILFDGIKKTIRERAMSVPAKRVKVFRAKLGRDAGIIGAATLAKLQMRPRLTS